MKYKIFFLTCIYCICFSSTFGQSLAEIKDKYGQPIEAYSVSETIWMTPKFTDNGQVCSVRLYPKRISSTTNYLRSRLDKWELKEVLDKLANSEARGKKGKLFGLTNYMGQMYETIYSYEEITFSFLSSLNTYGFQITKSKPTVNQTETTKKKIAEDEMLIDGDAEIVTIRWNKRTCTSK